jgi:hypothetical protein
MYVVSAYMLREKLYVLEKLEFCQKKEEEDVQLMDCCNETEIFFLGNETKILTQTFVFVSLLGHGSKIRARLFKKWYVKYLDVCRVLLFLKFDKI